jgi:hypothetical protein
MTIERDSDLDPTIEILRPVPPASTEIEQVEQDFDPEKTLVREDWESVVIRRVAPRVAAVQDAAAQDEGERFGWESEGLRRLSQVVQREMSGDGMSRD